MGENAFRPTSAELRCSSRPGEDPSLGSELPDETWTNGNDADGKPFEEGGGSKWERTGLDEAKVRHSPGRFICENQPRYTCLNHASAHPLVLVVCARAESVDDQISEDDGLKSRAI